MVTKKMCLVFSGLREGRCLDDVTVTDDPNLVSELEHQIKESGTSFGTIELSPDEDTVTIHESGPHVDSPYTVVRRGMP